MELIVDADHPGTPECQWRQSGRLRRLAPLELARPRRAVVVAPHPDDEVLGAGGLVRVLAGSGTAVRILAVTDGEASHPGAPATLAARRREESRTALHRLGAGAAAACLQYHRDRFCRLSSLKDLVQQDSCIRIQGVCTGNVCTCNVCRGAPGPSVPLAHGLGES